MTSITLRQGLCAGLLALGLHVLAVLVVNWWLAEPGSSGSAGAGMQMVSLSMAAEGAASAGTDGPMTPDKTVSDAVPAPAPDVTAEPDRGEVDTETEPDLRIDPEMPTDAPPLEQPVPPDTPLETLALAVAPAEQRPQERPAEETLPDPAPDPSPEEATPLSDLPPAEVVPPRAMPVPQAETAIEKAPPLPQRRPPRPAKVRPEPPAGRQVAAAPEPPVENPVRDVVVPERAVSEPASAAPARGPSAAKPSEPASPPAAPAGGGPAVGGVQAAMLAQGAVGDLAPDYVRQLRYWLERNKTYPREARRKRMQGVVHLAFRILRDGSVLQARIVKRSGFEILDEEARAMLRRAQPLPPFDASMRGGYLDITVPVSFALRGNR